ncbi:MAG: bifunctional methylenetetrahydrofolate dehydrogenase/methenyltetrahydrofolate cyclohydrolase FolD [Coriobacteriia bacterium]|nr:bifunctional methylenetetrahydrofolate dehydrogenase/methenyltetrahydrofolate cyclohydrolase FolD [Coriobacteriia bacterium]MDZ4654407.1 bifunctional methylenetetrahydrofolate dehydrogenase/methenyltetrahydrofolate cyclohydrolase FolD [Coriobacteriia bacterium]
MTATIIDGKAIAARKRAEVAIRVQALEARGITPGLAVVIVGDDPASEVYVRGKEKACDEVGIYSTKHTLPETTTQAELLALVGELNCRSDIHGVLVQLPLPGHIDEDAVIEAIDPAKDVDGFHPLSVGKMLVGQQTFLPCTPHGVMVLLEETGVDLTGKEVVVVGRSNIVGKPVSMLLLSKNATVTICHSRTADLDFHTGRADVLVVGVGQPEMIKGSAIKPGAIVIDVGINRVDGRLVGDVEFDTAVERAGAITPVPGGVGPMTIAMLMDNAVTAAERATAHE